jgi:hypothetical protein
VGRSTYPAFEIDTMVVVADATDALGDLLALLSEALMLTTGRFKLLLGLRKAHGRFWRAARTAVFWFVPHSL